MAIAPATLIKPIQPLYRKFLPWLLLLAVGLLSLLAGCSLPQVSAEERLFLNLSLDLVGEYQLPQTMFQDTPVGGLSGLAYDRKRDRFYAVSDDRSEQAPARFYTLKLVHDAANTDAPFKVEVESVTRLTRQDGQPYPPGSIDPEGIALLPQQTVFISSEGAIAAGTMPTIDEFDLTTGRWQQGLQIPDAFLPDKTGDQPQHGIQNNFGFESLTLSPVGTLPTKGEAIRLFTATESALLQDLDLPTSDSSDSKVKNRFVHYLVSDGPPVLISEHLYVVEPNPKWTLLNGLAELVALDQGGHFLSLERSLGFLGYRIQLFQLATGGATDIKDIASLKGDVSGLQPIRKQLLLDSTELGIPLKNIEGMALGPRLADGSQSLLLVSDNNFQEQATQFLLFRLKGGR